MTRVKVSSVLSCALLACFVTLFDATLLAQGTGPDAPVLLTPANGAVGVSTMPTLGAYVSDPDGGILTAQVSLRRVTAEEFTIIALPDTQYYSQSYPATFTAQTQWIVNNRQARNIVFVTHEGDIVQNAGSAAEWQRADTSMKLLEVAGIPFGAAPGNHDQPTTLYNQYFGVSRYQGRSYYGGNYQTNNDNNYQLFSGGGMDFVILHLDYCPPAAVVTWASSILQSFPDRIGIVTTHALLDGSGNRKAGGCVTQYLWDGLAVPNPNLRFMLAGHISNESRRTDSVNGRTVHQMLADYQERTNGGNGWLRILRFVPADNKVYVQTYSPTLGTFETDANSQFSLDFTMSSSFQNVGSVNLLEGSDAEIIPTVLSPFTTYEWRMTVTNGQGQSRTGPTWTFTTGAGNGATNQPPVATAQSVTVPEDASTFVTLSGSDPDNNPLTFTIVTGPTHGTLTGTAPNLTYIPAANYFGGDTFSFRVSDGQLSSAVETVSITVQSVNDQPTASGEAHTVQSGNTLTVAAPGVLSNDTDIDGPSLTAVLATGPTQGTLTLNANGSFTYTPAPGYVGTDTFTYTAADGLTVSSPATVTFTITPPAGSGNVRAITFEGGALIHATSGADATSGTVSLETAAPLKGSYAARVATKSSYLEENFTAASDLYVSFYLRLSALPSSDVQLLRIMNGSSQVGTFVLRSGGQLRLRNNSSTIGSDSAALTVGQLYRVGIHQRAKTGSSNNGVLEGFLASGDTAFGAAFASSNTGSWSTSATQLRLGTITSVLVNLVLDDIKLDNTLMPAPVAGPLAPTGLTALAPTAAAVDLSWSDVSSDETAFRIERAGSSNVFAEIATVASGATVYTDTTVVPGALYNYRVRGDNAGNLGLYSPVATVATPEVPPQAPIDLNAVGSSSAVQLSWTDTATNESSFSVERAEGSGDFVEIAVLAANAISHSDTTVSPTTAYTYRVRARNSADYSSFSNSASVVIPLPPVPPLAPTDLNAIATSPAQIELSWTDNSGTESLFRIERAGTNGIFAEVATVPLDVAIYTDTTVAPATTYTYRVRATNAEAASGYSNTSTVTTPPAPGQTLKLMTFENGAVTDPLTGADAVSGTVTFETAAPLRGTRSAKITGSAYLQEDVTASADLTVTFYLRLTTAPSSDVRLAFLSNSGTSVGALFLLSTGQLRLKVGSTTIGLDSAPLVVGTTYRVSLHQRQAVGATPRLMEAFVATGDNAFGAPFASSETNSWSGNADRLRLGGTNGSVSVVVDDVTLVAAP
ncbi:MAG: Ig-like domain-containing protein [Vicinamibacterales bacterium]